MNEVAIPTTTDVEKPAVVLDTYAQLVQEEKFLYETIKEWTKKHKAVEKQLRELLGDNELATFAGRPVYTYERIDRLNETEFTKLYPYIAEAYTATVEKRELDVARLKRDQPEKFRECQVRQFKRVS